MKRVISFLLLTVLAFGLCILPAAAGTAATTEPTAAEDKVKLSTLSEDECMAFLSKMDVHIPADLVRLEVDLPRIVKNFFYKLDENPDALIIVGYTSVMELFMDVRNAVLQYYGLPDIWSYTPPAPDPAIRRPSYARSNVKLSSMSEDECMEFISKMRVGIPVDLIQPSVNLKSMVKDMLSQLEANPNAQRLVSAAAIHDLFEQLRDTVKAYYGLTEAGSYTPPAPEPAIGGPSYAKSNVKLSSMSEDECMTFLSKMRVGIPVDLIQPGVNLKSMVKDMLSQLEANPDDILAVSATPVHDLFEEIRYAVKKYYGLAETGSHTPPALDPAVGGPSYAKSSVKLSSMSEDECMTFLSKMRVGIPVDLIQPGINLKSMVKDMLSQLEANPNDGLAVSATPVHDLFEAIRYAVKKYYGFADTEMQNTGHNSQQNTSSYSLQDSTVSSWNSGMENYNCYAYALGKNTWCKVGEFCGKSYNDKDGILMLAMLVQEDLRGDLGYRCVKIQESRPTSSSGWANVIAVRKDITGDYNGFNDYHFAKLSSSGWFHKPGGTAILKFNNPPTNNAVWTNECYNGFWYLAPTIWYESDICYLLYKANHGEISYTSTGQHYHSGAMHYYEYVYKCKDCGKVTETVWMRNPCPGPPCPVHISGIDDSQIA